MLAGREDLARQALARRAVILAQVARLREQQDALRAGEDKMTGAARRLQEKTGASGMQGEAVKAACTAARARAGIAGAFAGISGEVADAGTAARRAGDQEADLQARAGALDDLLPPGAPGLGDEQLRARLDQISTRAEVDEELARLRERLAPGGGQGHRAVPHAADLRVEAWAPAREACLAEAVRGLAGSFAVVAAARPRHAAERRFIAGSDEDLLVAVVDEVICRLDADGEIPVAVAVRPAPDGGVVLVLPLAGVREAEITGPAPKAASLHDLRCAPDPAGRWWCGITIDV